MAHSPEHYGSNWRIGDFIREQELSFHLGNVVKYVCRAGKKANNTKQRDLEQAIAYLENELEHTIYESELTGPSGAIPKCIQFASDWEDSASDPEVFDR
ncbi:MAG: hypothetical protein CL557_11045 [Alphaproteobacteria bacterium]|nr:hypothetical protein [Alphaproteobacteria bacterium]|tara:strand:+ start:9610 stop:9906 length:297 start_codon:yes stop_codon:yes gene_type:complete